MNRILSALFLALSLLVSPFADATSVVFLDPGRSDEVFWSTYARFMQAAATELGMQLRVEYSDRNPQLLLEQARQVLQGPNRPDYLLFTNEESAGPETLRLSQGSGVTLFAVNNSVTNDQQRFLGESRTRYPNWIGSLVGNDEEASYRMTKALIAKVPTVLDKQEIDMLAFTGTHTTPVAQLREQGMRRALAEHPQVHLRMVVQGDWAAQRAYEQGRQLFKRYPKTRLVWAANDEMAFGAMKALEEAGGKPGTDVYFAAINSSDAALQAYLSGRLSVLVGGHFALGGWAMVLIHDYAAGHDFAQRGGKDRSIQSLQVLDRDQAQWLLHAEKYPGYGVDFKSLSVDHNPSATGYDFTLQPLATPAPR